MRTFKVVTLGIICCVFAAMIIGTGPAPSKARAQESVKIGVLIPLTGSSAFGGKKELIGIQIAVDEVNQLGGVLGRKLELIVEDTESRPQAAMDGIHKLVDVNNVPLVIGCHNSSSTIPSATYANSREEHQISIADLLRLGYGREKPDLHLIERALHIEALTTGWRKLLMKKLAEYQA